MGTAGFVLSLSWISQVTAGHTKRITTNAIMLGAYCVGNAAGPFMWQSKFSPRCVLRSFISSSSIERCLCRNHIPWAVIGICYLICPFLMLIIRYMLARENKKRDNEPHDDTYDDVWLKQTDADGKIVERRVDKVS